MLLSSSKWLPVREAGAIFVWPALRHWGHPFPLAVGVCTHSSFEFLFAGLHFLPSGQGIHAHSVAGVRWQGLVPEKDTKAPLSLSLSLSLPSLPPSISSSPLYSRLPCPSFSSLLFKHQQPFQRSKTINITRLPRQPSTLRHKRLEPASVSLGYWWSGI